MTAYAHQDPEYLAGRRAWRDRHIRDYIGSGGVRGHIIDMSFMGANRFTTMLLLRTIGRKSGRPRIIPLGYGHVGNEAVIVASNYGLPTDPAWFLNMQDAETVDIQIATQAFRAAWRLAEGEERAVVWDYMLGLSPPYRKFREGTGRQFPVVLLSPREEIDIFREIPAP